MTNVPVLCYSYNMYVNWVRVWGVSDMSNVTTTFADPLKQKLLWSEEFSTLGAVNQVGLACLRGGGKGYRVNYHFP